MVATITRLTEAASTVHYFEADGYYAKHDAEHRKASRWHGRGVDALGLHGPVKPRRFEQVRNPLDVAVSSADFMGTDLDRMIDLMATEYLETPHDPERNNVSIASGSWSQHVASWTGRTNKRLHVVRYEDMIGKPSVTFGSVARFLGLKPSRQRLLRAIRNSSFRTMQRQEATGGFHERSGHQKRFFRRGKAGGWKDDLSESQIQRICEAHGEQMKRFGYLSPDGQPAIG